MNSYYFIFICGGLMIFGNLIDLTNCQIDCSKPPSFKEASSCCKVPDSNKTIGENCGKLHGIQIDVKPIESHNTQSLWCFFECISKDKGYLKDDNLDVKKIRELTLLALKELDEPSKRVFTNTIEICVLSANARATKMAAKLTTAPKCSPLSYFFADCIGRKIFLNCPDALWRKDANCDVQREFMRKCFLPKTH